MYGIHFIRKLRHRSDRKVSLADVRLLCLEIHLRLLDPKEEEDLLSDALDGTLLLDPKEEEDLLSNALEGTLLLHHLVAY